MVETIPGTRFKSKPVRGARGVATRTGRAFVAGLTEKGSHLVPAAVTSLGDFETKFGEGSRALSVLPDWVELYFAAGGAELVVARTVGDAAAKATRVLNDASGVPVPVLRVEAIDVGEYGNSLSVQVVAGSAGGLFTLVILDNAADPDVELERHTDLASVAAAVEALLTSAHVRGVDLAAAGSPDPAVAAAAALTGGTDNLAAVLAAEHIDALNLIDAGQGPGQVALPGQTSAAAHAALIAHGEARNRFALLDAPDGADAAALLAVPVADRADLDSSWVEMAPLSGTRNRKVPSSALRAGLYAAGDARYGHANHAPAGADGGRSPAVVGVTREFAAAEWTALAEGGVNLIRVVRENDTKIVERFGSRTRNPGGDYAQVGWMRYEMSVQDRFDLIAAKWLFRVLRDRRKITQYGAELRAVLADDYALTDGPLFGDTVDDALFVDVGPEVNTLASLAAGQLRSRAGVKNSPFAELVENTYSKIAIDQPLRAA